VEPLPDSSTRNWTEPGIYTVAPGVYRIPLPLPNDGLKAVNIYVVTDGSRLTLIDSGWALDEARTRLRTALNAIGAELGDIGEFLITHMHRDHYTMAIALRREFGGSVALGQLEEPSVKASADPDTRAMHTQGRLLVNCGAAVLLAELVRAFGSPRRGAENYEQPDEWLVPGSRTVLPSRDLEIVHTPGHTAGHVVFDDAAAGLLFSGDHVLPHITPSIGFQPEPVELPLHDYLDSLRLIRERPDRMLLPAHGPVTTSTHERVDELLAHHDERLSATGDTVAAGASTAYEAANALGWTRRKRALSDLDIFNRTLAVLETAAHLDVLVQQGRLNTTEVDDVRHYFPA
jgi:glyoxylase-like metal-dependent hydrolase (beta-lactamase superfamily II)